MTTVTHRPAPHVPGIPTAHQPAGGGAPGWPVVLYFHHVNAAVRHYTALSPRDFGTALELLLDSFDPYRPADLLAPGGPVRPDRPTVLVTFDDGYRDNFTQARPILDRFGVKAVFFAVTGKLGTRGDGPREDYLDWEQCDELAAQGHLVAAHTRSHPHLDRVPAAEAARETTESLADIAARYGAGPGRLFAYPYGGVPDQPAVPADVLAFGTVRSAAAPWTSAPQAIRRTYLPVGQLDAWPTLISYWRQLWAPRY